MTRIAFMPDLAEEAVLLVERQASAPVARAFRRERDQIYELTDPEAREAGFHALHSRWFVRFNLGRTVEQVVGERADVGAMVSGCRVFRAASRLDEGADLADPAGTVDDRRPAMLVRLRPAALLEPASLQTLLRHELMHVADMLDPAFAYERTLSASDSGPSHDNLVRDRYRVLWDVTIDGRLVRAGLLDPQIREARWREFAATFAMLDHRCLELFEEWFDGTQPTHGRLVAFAFAPGRPEDGEHAGSGRCPLCRFPVAWLDPHPERLSEPVRSVIRADDPSWNIEQGLCSQCLDLYEARYEETVEMARR